MDNKRWTTNSLRIRCTNNCIVVVITTSCSFSSSPSCIAVVFVFPSVFVITLDDPTTGPSRNPWCSSTTISAAAAAAASSVVDELLLLLVL